MTSDNNFSTELSEAIKNTGDINKARRPKPHLIALSILCQGYLAVYDQQFKNKLPAGVKSADKLPDDWWAPAFGTKTVFNKTETYKELGAIGKDIAAIEYLFKVRDKEGDGVKIVNAAYKFLTEIVLSPAKKNAQ